jgi:hypothetical protein
MLFILQPESCQKLHPAMESRARLFEARLKTSRFAHNP